MSLTIKYLKESLSGYRDDARVITQNGEDIIHIVNTRNGDMILSTRKPIGECKNCGGYIYPEESAGLKEEYVGICPNCDENMYGFEIINLKKKKK